VLFLGVAQRQPADSVINVASHEHNETITDPPARVADRR
jgi:hypothetical protein